ncbi:MAG: amidohydrolase/deacetylase family metallohydrolase [Rhodobacteraceae bacterium]|nr:amidohydrolase/deacetylase family metallohydrolase [Paracoccaceae bacterium]
MRLDLVLAGGRVIDPSQGIDRIADVGFADGRCTGVGKGLAQGAAQVRDVTGLIVTPGLIDLHTHVYWGGTSLGVDADAYALQSAVTTSVDAGSAGPGNFAGFRRHVIEPATGRVLAYLHVSFAGIFAFSNSVMVGESHDFRLMAARDAVAVARANPDLVIGIKVRLGRHASGPSGIAPLDVALDVADETGLPLMVHIDEPPPTYEAVVDRLRSGDVLTHCLRPFPNAVTGGDGVIKPAVLAARERGVLFDVGHGMGSFSWRIARKAVAAGFLPDTISSDVHALCIDGPAYDLLRTMTKFLALGLSLDQVIAATTCRPAAAIRRPDLGALTPGAAGDASVVSLKERPIGLEDVEGEIVHHDSRLTAEGLVVGGRWLQTGGV